MRANGKQKQWQQNGGNYQLWRLLAAAQTQSVLQIAAQVFLETAAQEADIKGHEPGRVRRVRGAAAKGA